MRKLSILCQPPPRGTWAVVLLALLTLAGCAALPSDGFDVRATLVGERPGRPPLTRLLVDLSVTNASATPRWVLIPSNLPTRAYPPGSGINHLEQQTATASGGRVAVGRMLGRAGNYALRLAPGARVTLRHLEIGWWRGVEPPASPVDIAFELRLAGAVTIDDQPLAGWFDGDPTISGATEIDMASAPHTHSHAAPGGRELPLATNDVTTLSVRLARP